MPNLIDQTLKEFNQKVQKLLKSRLKKIILYGS